MYDKIHYNIKNKKLKKKKKTLPAVQEMQQEPWIQSLGWEDLLGKEMATHSSILAWKIPWIEEPQRVGSQRVRRDLVTKQQQIEYFRTRNISTISLNKILKWKIYYLGYIKGFPGSSENKESAAMQETQVQSLGWEDPLEKRMACLENCLDRRIWWIIVHGVAKSQLH